VLWDDIRRVEATQAMGHQQQQLVDSEMKQTFHKDRTCHQGLQPFGSQDSFCCTIQIQASLHLEQRMRVHQLDHEE
jgi:hypothetical protein